MSKIIAVMFVFFSAFNAFANEIEDQIISVQENFMTEAKKYYQAEAVSAVRDVDAIKMVYPALKCRRSKVNFNLGMSPVN